MNQLPKSFSSFSTAVKQGARNHNTSGRWQSAGRGFRRGVPNYGRGGRSTGGRGKYNHKGNIEVSLEKDMVQIDEIGTEDGVNSIRVAVQGCSHGALERIYDTLTLYQEKSGKQIDLLLCCGDFQALRNVTDMETISVPSKYREMGSFYKYYSGLKKAPILTICVGGNHEASSYLQELYYGGWIAPNIYYLGASGVVRYRGIRIAGISGIYKHNDYEMGRHEKPPYDHSTLRSVYHVRNVEVARLKVLERIQKQLSNTKDNQPIVDIMISHDWPRGIERYGNTAELIRKKKFFQKEIADNSLGSPSNEELLKTLKPRWWFAAHLHVKFLATYRHQNLAPNQVPSGQSTEGITPNTSFIALESSDKACASVEEHDQPDLTDQMTQFLCLDKCLPRRHHIQVVNTAVENNIAIADEFQVSSNSLKYDLEWLAILQKTHHWTKCSRARFPEPNIDEIVVTNDDIESVRAALSQGVSGKNEDPTVIPSNFSITLQPHGSVGSDFPLNQGKMIGNPQTDKLLNMLGMEHVITVPYIYQVGSTTGNQQESTTQDKNVTDDNEIDLDD